MSVNSEVARILFEIGELYSIKGESFKSRAYRLAAQRIESLTENVKEVYERGELQTIPGVGKSIGGVIEEYIQSGGSRHLDELLNSLPEGAQELMTLEGLGPKTIMKLYDELKVTSIDQLEKAARSGKISGLKGFGSKSEVNILQAIKEYRGFQKRFLLGQILPVMREIEEYMETCQVVLKVDFGGSARRMKETVGDLDVLVASEDGDRVVEHFVSMSRVTRVLSKGSTRSSIIVGSNLQIDLRVILPESYGSALQYFTGSKEHNIKLRSLAQKSGFKLNEYGLFRRKDGEKVAGEREEGVYALMNLQYIEPELREDRGEVEAAMEKSLPKLVEYSDVKGDLHVHSSWSDGNADLETIAAEARSLDLEYIAICDHSRSLGIARGLDENRLRKQMHEIDRVNEGFEGFRLLKGIEANIMADGSLDLPSNVLQDLDFVVASIHSGFKSESEKLTERMISAIHNDYVSTIGHPTGRLIQRRKPYPIDLRKVFDAAADQKVMMEINAFPNRLDLNDVNSRAAKNQGVSISIGTDAHSVDQLRYLPLGISVARRGWLQAEDIVNALHLKDLLRRTSK
jgi:DNA polymerase (family 10)